jgi:hypothetical protein
MYFPKNAYVSYQTCGATDRYTEYDVQNAWQGRTIRIGFPTPERPHVFPSADQGLVEAPNGDLWTGTTVALALDLFGAAGLNFTVGEISPISRELYPLSSYTACVHSVFMGLLDMCIGAFGITSERLALTSAGTTIFADYMVLLTRVHRMHVPTNRAGCNQWES